ncbi:MAG: response regulator [Thiomargarita sp.]|nr:response regulator [Thiomargarita sp.]
MFLNNFVSKISRKIPLKIVIIVPFVIEIFAVVGLTGWLSFRNGEKAVDDLATQLRNEMTTRIHQHLTTHTTMPLLANKTNVDAINLGLLKLEDIHALENHLWKQIQQFHTVSYIGIGTENAAYVGTQLLSNGTTLVEISDKHTNGHLEIWETNSFSNHTQLKKNLLKKTLPNYNLKNRPWYLNAVKAGKPVWSKTYFSSRRTTLSVNQPIYDNQKKLLAVATADISVLDISQFLHSLKIGKIGQSFIIERSSGVMVATSSSEKPYREIHSENHEGNQETSKKSEAFKAVESNDTLTRRAARHLIQSFGDLKAITNRQNLNLFVNGQPYSLQVMPFNDEMGLDWLIVVVVADADFMAHIEANMYYTILLCLAALIITILGGIFSTQWIIQPLNRLNTTAKALAKGKWEQTVDFKRKDEVGELAKSFSRMTEQLQGLFTTLEGKNKELQRLDQLKDDFLANTSHELRTPLNGIIGIAESLIDGATGPLSTKTQSELSIIVASGQRLSNLVNDILDFSKQKHETIELELKPVDLGKITEIVVKFCQTLVLNKDLIIVNVIPNDLPMANADENRVQQILHNIIGNAIKFTERGRIEISATVCGEENFLNKKQCRKSSIEQLLITISDTGIGIPVDKTTQIFKSYEQIGDESTNHGTGLGLAITKQLVALHEGEIWVESTVGVGSRFIFTLPISSDQFSVGYHQKYEPYATTTLLPKGLSSVNNLKTSKADVLTDTEEREIDASSAEMETQSLKEHKQSPLTDASSLPQKLTKKDKQCLFKVMIVDDEPVNLHVLSNHLSLCHYSIIEAASGAQLLTILNQGIIPDIILLDVMMPYMTGYEVTQKIREQWTANELPIVLLTAKNQVADLVMGLEMGANDYLIKPTSKNELLARIKTHLHIKQLHKELEEYSHTLEQKVEERTYKFKEAKKVAEEALQQLKSTQEQLVESAKMAELGNLVAGVAHEINTPVGIGVTAASKLSSLSKELIQLYKKGKMKRADLEKYLKSVQQGSELTLKNLTRAAELIQSFKQVAVDQTGEKKRTFVLKNYLHEILTALRPKLKRTLHQVSIDCDEKIILSSYPGIFSQVLTNFIMNSLIHGFKNKPEGGQITITALMNEKVENNVILRYSDNGNGISPDVINKIFDPFFTTNRQEGGSGLGLNIVYNLVTHKLKGNIQCNSVEGDSTTFILSIPMQQDSNQDDNAN